MRAAAVLMALLLVGVAIGSSCSLKPVLDCADGGCWGEPATDGGGDGDAAGRDLATALDLTSTPD